MSGCSVERDGQELVVRLPDTTHVLTPTQARELHTTLGEKLTQTETFAHTTGEHRADGTYVVARRRADSAGHRKVFDSPAALFELYEQLPPEFTACDVDTPGLSGGRRHMLVHHFTEHPAFDCGLVRRQPLTARKTV